MTESQYPQTVPASERTVGEIVADDYRTARVFENHGIDFCCGGKFTLGSACADKGIDSATITGELDEVKSEPTGRSENYASSDPPFLVDYIINAHHTYIKENTAPLAAYAHKIAEVHGAHHPEVIKIAPIFGWIANDPGAPYQGENE